MTIKPRGDFERSDEVRKAPAHAWEPQFEMAVWCPDDKAEAPPEQVHFLIHWPAQLQMDGIPPMRVRFKSPDTLGFIIEELIKYRRVVWSDCEPIQGELDALHPGESHVPNGK